MRGGAGASKRELAAAEKQRALFDLIPEGSVVTAIGEVLSDPNLRSIRVGRRVVARLPRDVVAGLGVKEGTQWSEALASRIAQAAQLERARAAAARALERRPLSRREVVTRLMRQGFELAIATQAADDALRAGLIDERAYAEAVIRATTHSRPAGRRLLESKLMARGIGAETAKAAAADAVQDRDAYADALALAVSRRRSLRPGADPKAEARRLVGLLARRGFDAGVAFRAAREALGSPDLVEDPE